ncbi:two-component regulator propeller domain-containing protein [Adhaeribacter soli]|uniref:Histidine kinase domain-containing protein n=1 Tax=Adhaeribacter soli TaxID=2607655 RepID=A0A5N1J0E1_9BACT|nr:two-component regulator propeller domain-containing protein [Adhaeribacter soli]KAA9333802.1 hypothetical protein F0P94_11210 [Adhaeribacter soli]
MRIFFISGLLILWLTTHLSAQQYNFKTWNLEDGLPQSEITCLLQDRHGYLWLGTLGGLSRFNGFRFQNFSKEHGLSSNNIRCLMEDREGNIWIGTTDRGISLYNGRKFTHLGEKDGLPAGGITSITQAPDRTIWIATSKGIASYKNKKITLLPNLPDLPAQPYSALLADKRGNLWLGTLGDGLYRYNGASATRFSLEDGLTNKIIYSLLEARDGSIWIGTYGGLTRYDGKSMKQFVPEGDLNLNRAMSLSEDRNGAIWIGQDGGGVLKYDGKRLHYITADNGLESNYIATLRHDGSGNLWIGTVNSGLQRYTPSCFLYYSKLDGLKSENVTSLAKDGNGQLWVGTFDGGAARFIDGKGFTWFSQADGLPGNIINDLKIDKTGKVWLATNKGICRYDGKQFRNYNENDGLIYEIVNSCFPDSGNRVLLGTNEGFSIFNGKTFQNFKIPGGRNASFVQSVFKDHQSRIWVGTRTGLYEFRDNKFVSPPELQGFGLANVCAITQDRFNNLWIGSYNTGLLRYTPDAPNKRTAFYTQKNGLLSDGINSLQTDSLDQLWIGTIKGISRINLLQYQQKQQFRPKSFTVNDGFRGVEVNSNSIVTGLDGRMWFGTVSGLIKYLPFYEKKDTVLPKLAISNVLLLLQKTNWKDLGQPVNPKTGFPDKLTLNHDENYLTFGYQAIDLTHPEKVTYSYMLEGLELDWSAPTRDTFATYSNLSPGKYVFRVKACVQGGECNQEPVKFAFTIEPPFWSKDKLIGMVLLVAAGVVFGFVRWREQNLKKINTRLEESVEQRTLLLEKKNLEKEILLKEVHHRVKNNLQIITSLLNLQSRHVTDPAALHTLREIKDRIKSISMLHQRLYQREELSCIDLAEYVQTLCRSLFASYGVREDHVRLEFDIPTLYLDIDTALTLGLIVNELVSNTLKYAFPEHRKGTLLIELLRITETDYTLTISDDGTGLPDNFEEKMAASFGLQLVSSLVKKLHGKLRFYSEGGTQIRLQFIIQPQ